MLNPVIVLFILNFVLFFPESLKGRVIGNIVPTQLDKIPLKNEVNQNERRVAR